MDRKLWTSLLLIWSGVFGLSVTWPSIAAEFSLDIAGEPTTEVRQVIVKNSGLCGGDEALIISGDHLFNNRKNGARVKVRLGLPGKRLDICDLYRSKKYDHVTARCPDGDCAPGNYRLRLQRDVSWGWTHFDLFIPDAPVAHEHKLPPHDHPHDHDDDSDSDSDSDKCKSSGGKPCK